MGDKEKKQNGEAGDNGPKEEDVGAEGDETTDDEGGVDTPPPQDREDDDDQPDEEGNYEVHVFTLKVGAGVLRSWTLALTSVITWCVPAGGSATTLL